MTFKYTAKERRQGGEIQARRLETLKNLHISRNIKDTVRLPYLGACNEHMCMYDYLFISIVIIVIIPFQSFCVNLFTSWYL